MNQHYFWRSRPCKLIADNGDGTWLVEMLDTHALIDVWAGEVTVGEGTR